MSAPLDITSVLREHRDDARAAADRLFPLVYDELRRLARRQLARRPAGETLAATALVHEVYLRLAGDGAAWRDRVHFFAVAARAMRHVVTDHARRRAADKRGGGRTRITLDDALVGADADADRLLVVDDALTRLGSVSPRLVQVVELRFFGGLREAEIAAVLGVSERTVQHDWRTARAWLARALADTPDGAPDPGPDG